MFSRKIQKQIAIFLLCIQIAFLSVSDGYGSIIRNSLDDLPFGEMEGVSYEDNIFTPVEKNEATLPYEEYFVFDTKNESILTNTLIKKKTVLHGMVESSIITSELLEDTLIKNEQKLALEMENFGISPIDTNELEKARAKFQIRDGINHKEIIGFEYGIPGEHLIFSKPVRLEISTPDIPNGSAVNLLVRHATDNEYNTSGLSRSAMTKCREDGSTTEPSDTTTVMNGKVVFYTCGASSFALGYTPIIDLPNNTVFTSTPTSDGGIIIGGQFTTVGGVARSRVARINSSGGLDTSFIDPNVNNIVYASTVQSDGKILIGGTFTGVAGTGRNRIARLNSDGTLDLTFNPNVNNQVRAISIQPDGKILIGGSFTTVGGVGRNRIARLNSDGSLDTTFNANAGNIVYTIALQSDGRVVLGGTFTSMGGVGRNRIARVSSTGGLDTTFNPNASSTVWDIEIDGGGNIIFGGQFTTVGGVGRNRIARVSATGGLDGGFNPNLNNTLQTLTIEPSGNIILGGAFTTVGGVGRNRIARVSATGGLDGALNPNASTTIYSFSQRNDGSIAVGGAFTSIFGAANTYLSYINPIESILDSRYNLYANGAVWTTAPYPTDARIIIGGQFTTVGGVTRSRVARISSSGGLDTSFINPLVDNIVYASAVQSDGKILIGGTFLNVGGVARNRIARLNSDGTLDLTFNPNVNNQVRAIALQSDGKILIGGSFTTVGGVGRNRIARLNSDGSLDTTFNANAGNIVYTIALQSDGRVVLGGTFRSMGGVTRNRIARVSSTGGLDTTFNPNASSTVWDIEIDGGGNIVFGGQFTSVGGVGRNRIARVSSTGGLDGGFNPNLNNTLQTLTIEPSGNIILGGGFTTVGGVGRNRIARVSSTGGLDGGFNPNANGTVYSLTQDIDNNLLAGGAFTTFGTKATRYFSWIGLFTPETTPPVISSISLASGTLLPIGNLTLTGTYFDTGAGILPSGVSLTLEKWGSGSWSSDIAPTYLSGSANISASSGVWKFSNISYGKYHYTLSVSDIRGNNTSITREFYIDAVEWSLSQPSVDIGDILPGVMKTSNPDEILITVKTVGAPFSLSMSGTPLTSSGETIGHWSGTGGYGYEEYSLGYSDILSSMSPSVTLVNQVGNINTNGEKNTYIYRIQYGALSDVYAAAGDYTSTLSFEINLVY